MNIKKKRLEDFKTKKRLQYNKINMNKKFNNQKVIEYIKKIELENKIDYNQYFLGLKPKKNKRQYR